MSEENVIAGRMRRLAATLIDAALVPALTIVLVMVSGIVEDAQDYADNSWMAWVLVLAITSYLILNGYGLWRSGQTIGKRLLGIAIVPCTSKTSSLIRGQFWALICIRALFFPLLFLVVTPLAVIPLIDQILIFTRKRRCLHGLAAGTMVIRVH
ncbi:MAG: RDD family protein [Proteobacteria bacterium]|nr:RDD family protein [Pseudomonadota bacterium]